MPPSSQSLTHATTPSLSRPVVAVAGTLFAVGIGAALLYSYATPNQKSAVISAAAPSSPALSGGSLSPVASPPKTDPRNLPNFAEVAPGIYRGAAPTAEGWKSLHALGIRTEIDLRIEKKNRAVAEAATKQYGIERLHLPMGAGSPHKEAGRDISCHTE